LKPPRLLCFQVITYGFANDLRALSKNKKAPDLGWLLRFIGACSLRWKAMNSIT